MDDFLYLDTARVGRPSPRTLHAATDSLRLAAEEGGSAYFDRFLAGGLAASPSWMQSRYAGLLSWRGVASLKADLRVLAGGGHDLPVLLANRSTQLMEFAARLLFPRCRSVLTCDLGWPAYQSVLERQALRTAGRVTVVPLRDIVFGGRATADEVVERVCRTYLTYQCDGLFLPAVSHDGVRLPVQRIVRSIEAKCEARLVVVDGCQEFCHADSALAGEYCDLYLAGCHKWLGGHHPMGVGFYGRRRTRGYVDTMLGRLIAAGVIDDPLLRFAEHAPGGRAETTTETLNLSGLFTCQAAVTEARESGDAVETFSARLMTGESITRIATDSGWRIETLDHTLRSAILLVNAPSSGHRQTDPASIRASFRDRGVGVTAYEGGAVRLSMPTAPLSPKADLHLQKAFRLWV